MQSSLQSATVIEQLMESILLYRRLGKQVLALEFERLYEDPSLGGHIRSSSTGESDNDYIYNYSIPSMQDASQLALQNHFDQKFIGLHC